MVITAGEMLLRMGASVVLGAAIGYERERTGRPAGLRTHLLVCLAAATFMLVSTQFVYYQHYSKDDLIAVDTSRIAASVVTGVGFLGAGAILRTGLGIQGLTTAASLWLVSAVGLAAGGGMFAEAVTATIVTLFSLVLLRRVEGKQWRLMQRRMAITFEDGGATGAEVVERLRALGVEVADTDYDRNVAEKKSTLSFEVRAQNQETLELALKSIEALPGVARVKVQRPS